MKNVYMYSIMSMLVYCNLANAADMSTRTAFYIHSTSPAFKKLEPELIGKWTVAYTAIANDEYTALNNIEIEKLVNKIHPAPILVLKHPDLKERTYPTADATTLLEYLIYQKVLPLDAEPNKKTESLYRAARLLLYHRACINHTYAINYPTNQKANYQRYVPLFYAIVLGNVSVFKALWDYDDGQTKIPLLISAEKKDNQIHQVPTKSHAGPFLDEYKKKILQYQWTKDIIDKPQGCASIEEINAMIAYTNTKSMCTIS